jgi:hypothetical protein
LWRLAHDPRRLAHRYLVRDPRFVVTATRALAARQVDCAHYAELAAGAEIGFSAGPAPSQPTKPAKKKPPIITVQ